MRCTFFILWRTLSGTLSAGNGQTGPYASHVVHIGIDGLRPDCIELAPGGAPNMLTRFRSEVGK